VDRSCTIQHMKTQIINDDGDVIAYVNLADNESFDSLSDFLNGIGDYTLEEVE